MPIHLVLSFGSTKLSILAAVRAEYLTEFILHAVFNGFCLSCDKKLTSILLMFLLVCNSFVIEFIFLRVFVQCCTSGITAMLMMFLVTITAPYSRSAI